MILYDYFFDIVWIFFWYCIDIFWYYMNIFWYCIDIFMILCGYFYDIVWIFLWYCMYIFFILYGWFFDIVYRCFFICSGWWLVCLRMLNYFELNFGSKLGWISYWGWSYLVMLWNENGWCVLFYYFKEKLNFF